MNDFGFIDYKKPIGLTEDLRTSTYRGHVHMTDTMMGNCLNLKIKESRAYEPDRHLEEKRVSEHKANYLWKYGDPDDVRNPSLSPKIQFIKPLEDCRLRFLKRPMLPPCSVSHKDYLWHPKAPPEPPAPIAQPTAVEVTKIVIDRSKPGYSKYLDPSATTSNLAYVSYTPNELMAGVSAKDNITFWNWHTKHEELKRVYPEKDPIMCDTGTTNECPKRRCEFINDLKRVPHSGMTTEVRENYLEPYKRAIDVNTSHIRNRLVNVPVEPHGKDTEYKMYGSGERTQKFV